MGVHKADRKGKTDEHAWAGSDPASAQARREALYLVLAQVPPGQVVSYGQLAELAGLGRAARWVGRTLSQLPVDTRLPWHRVLGAGGRISLPADSPAVANNAHACARKAFSCTTTGWTYVGMAGLQRSRAVRVRVIFCGTVTP